MLAVGLRVGPGGVDDAVTVIRWRVQRVQPHGRPAGVDDVVIRPGRDNDRESRSDLCGYTVEDGLARAGFHAEELVERVDLE